MESISATFISSIILCYLTIKLTKKRIDIFGDNFEGPQKIHEKETPRIGGLGIFSAIVIGGIFTAIIDSNELFLVKFMIYTTPTLIIGLLEDCVKDISIELRILFMTLSSISAIIWMDIAINNVDLNIIDTALEYKIISYFFTIFCIVGLINAYNIIDGSNGLSSMSAMISLTGLFYTGYSYGEYDFSISILIYLAAVLGFFIFNYPSSKLFLGDSGAYLIGLILAVNTIFLVNKVDGISPWFPVLLNLYPITETIFTIIRRKFLEKKQITGADSQHLHSILYKKFLHSNIIKSKSTANNCTSTTLWLLPVTSCILAVIFRENTTFTIISIIFIITIYIFAYFNLNNRSYEPN